MLSRRDGNGTGRWDFFFLWDGTGIEYGSDLSDGMGWDYHVLEWDGKQWENCQCRWERQRERQWENCQYRWEKQREAHWGYVGRCQRDIDAQRDVHPASPKPRYDLVVSTAVYIGTCSTR